MKKIYFFVIMNIFLLSLFAKEIQYKNFLLNFIYNKEILIKIDKIKKKEIFIIAGDKESKFYLYVEISQIKEKIIQIFSDSNFYFELYYDEKFKQIIIKNMLGDFKIKIFNSYFKITFKIDDNTIINNVSCYNIVSYPYNLLYILLSDGKLQFLKNKNSIIIIAGESLTIMEGKVYISEFNDYHTVNNIFMNKIYINRNKDFNNKKGVYFNKIKKHYIDSIVFKESFIKKIDY